MVSLKRRSGRRRLETAPALPADPTGSEGVFARIVRLTAGAVRAREARLWFRDPVVGECRVELVSEDPEARLATVGFCGMTAPRKSPHAVGDWSRVTALRVAASEPAPVRACVGVPLRSSEGTRLGALCVLDSHARHFSVEDLDLLEGFARWAEDEVRLRELVAIQERLSSERESLLHRARVDPLTLAWNRAEVLDALERESARATRRGTPLSVMMADVDHFKRVNDTHGHVVGDLVLSEVAQALRAALRPYDSLGRFGGEEFLIVLPDCPPPAALRIAERMRAQVAALRVPGRSGSVDVSLSVGVATAPPAPAAQLVERADGALYQAKHAGRDRVLAAS